MKQKYGAKQSHMGLGLKLEALFCGSELLVGTVSVMYIVKKYSDYMNYGGMYFGKLQGENGLTTGWMFPDRLVDLRDHAYRRRRNMIADGMVLWMIAGAALKRVMRRYLPKHEKMVLVIFYGLYACYFHRGAKILLLIFYVTANYYITKLTAGTKYGPMCVWGYNLVWLFFAKERQFRMWMIEHSKAPIWGMGNLPVEYALGNMTLKNISYGLDHHWARLGKPGHYANLRMDHPEIAYKERIDTHLPFACYNDIWTYLQFQFYPPLYTEGPIITFNDFISQYKGLKVHRTEKKQLFWYGFRVLLIFLLVECSLHFTYADAILKTSYYKHLLGNTSQFANPNKAPVLGCLGLVSFFCWGFLMYYLKSVVEWRWGRFWSLVDGIDPPEDFVKCIARAKSMPELWRYWHASINKWCSRYIYIPLGGSKAASTQKSLSIFLVFMFIALWHSINADSLIWGIALAAFIILEMVVRWMSKPTSHSTNVEDVPRLECSENKNQQQSVWSERLYDIMSMFPILGFTIINMGAFIFGFSSFYTMKGPLTTELSGWVPILLGVYCTQRCTSIYNRWNQTGFGSKVHINEINKAVQSAC